jgi:DNA sulfur modification protein DndD
VTQDQQAHLQRRNVLENDAGTERTKNDFLKECASAYASVHKHFLAFKHDLERKRTEAIQLRIAHYYRQINAGDSEAESVDAVSVQIPDDTNQKYGLVLKYRDGNERNAMHVLSEGHLRALGLAIMLAIAEKYSLPFLIFDDAVNAIDSDHRANIIEMMFTDDYLSRTQLLVTTHDRLFWERFCLELGRQMNGEDNMSGASFVVKYPACGTGSVFSQYNVDFEQKITVALDHFDLRQAMIYLRIWLETEILRYIGGLKGQILVGRLHQSRKYRGNALEPNITEIFSKMSKFITESNGNRPPFEQSVRDAWSFLQQKLIDDVLNQDNHAYSESLLNVTHSKTSNEVQEIFEKVKMVVEGLKKSTKASTGAISIATLAASTANILATDSELVVGLLDSKLSPGSTNPTPALSGIPEVVQP